MVHAASNRLLAAALGVALACPVLGQAEEPNHGELLVLVFDDARSSAAKARSWKLALEQRPLARPGIGKLRLGEIEPTLAATASPAPVVAAPAPNRPQALPSREIFASLSDNRLLMRPATDQRQARLAATPPSSLDWSGYEARDQRAGDSLSESVKTLEWPDLEGGSEPMVSTVSRTPDGKRSGLGLGWRF